MCPNDPGERTKDTGVCHVCAMRDRLPAILAMVTGPGGRSQQEVHFCPLCCHWFCYDCWNNVMGRFTGFLDKHVRGTPDGCCGPGGV